MRRVWEQARARRRAEAGEREAVAVREESATPEVEALLAAVRRPAPRRGEGSAEAALAAYREARDSGVHALPGRWWRARRRDDWRPSRRRGVLPVRAAFASVAATVTLGGMALAAGTGAIPAPFGSGGGSGGGSGSGGGGAGAGTTGTYSAAPATPGTERGSAGDAAHRPSAAVTRSATARPSPAQDDVAYCAGYLASDGRGDAFRRGAGAASEQAAADAEAAGQSVEAYCEGLLEAGERPGPESAGKGSPQPSKAAGASKAPQPSKAAGASKAPQPSKAAGASKAPQPSKAAGTPRTPEPPARPADDPAKPAKPANPAKPAGKGEGGGDQGGNGAQRNGESGSRKH